MPKGTPKGHYLNDSNYYVVEYPDGTAEFYCQESDFWDRNTDDESEES